MTARRFALLLALYVSLDFANPLMPGAVWFLDGSVDMVHADRVRPESVPIDAALADLPAHGQPDVLLQAPRLKDCRSVAELRAKGERLETGSS